MDRVILWTIGHSTRPIGELVEMLRAAGIRLLVDVRAHPGSRRHPQFNREALAAALGEAGIAYRWQGEALGGRRKPAPGSPNMALRNASFRAYADYMRSERFSEAAAGLMTEAVGTRLAVMCAEHHPSRCHRRLIADWLTARGAAVEHLIDPGRREAHALTPGAVCRDGEVSYPGGESPDLFGAGATPVSGAESRGSR